MDMISIQAGLEGFKAAKDIIKTLIELKKFADHQGELNTLTSAIIAAQGLTLQFQAENATLITEKGALEKEISDLKAWEAEAQRYELQEIAPRVFAYTTKELMRGTEPVHHLCSQCYQDHIKSILQRSRVEHILHCPCCKTEFYLPTSPQPSLSRHTRRGP